MTMPTAGEINVTPLEDKTSEEEPVLYANKLEAKNAFKSLLESANVRSDCSWDQAMRVIISDKRYGALKTLGERKQALNGYLNQRKKIEVEERRVKQRKARDDFLTMLEECKDLTSSMRWSKAIFMFGHDERFNAVERSKEREDLFENYLVELEKKEQLRRQERKNHDEFRKMMEEHVADGTLNAKTYWRDYCSQVKDSRAYLAVVSNLSGLTPKELFDDVMEELDKQLTYEDQIERLKEKDLKEAKKRHRLGDNFLDVLCSIKGIMWIVFALLIHKGAAQIPIETTTFNISDEIGYRASLTRIRTLILTDPSCGVVGTHGSLPGTPANPSAPPFRILKINLFYGPSPSPKAALYMRWDSLYVMAVAEESGVVHYFPTYASIFESFDGSQALPYDESYAGLTDTKGPAPVYPEIAKVIVGRASAQNAIEFISSPAGFTMESTRLGSLTEDSAMEMMAWSALSQLYETGSLQVLSDRNFRKIKRLRPQVTTQEQAGNLIDLVYQLQTSRSFVRLCRSNHDSNEQSPHLEGLRYNVLHPQVSRGVS